MNKNYNILKCLNCDTTFYNILNMANCPKCSTICFSIGKRIIATGENIIMGKLIPADPQPEPKKVLEYFTKLFSSEETVEEVVEENNQGETMNTTTKIKVMIEVEAEVDIKCSVSNKHNSVKIEPVEAVSVNIEASVEEIEELVKTKLNKSFKNKPTYR